MAIEPAQASVLAVDTTLDRLFMIQTRLEDELHSYVMPQELEKAHEHGLIGKALSHTRLPGQIHYILAGEQVWEP